MKKLYAFGVVLFTLFSTTPLLAEEWGNVSLSYIREVSNQLFLSDFQLGSQETIRDEDGHGFAIGRLFKNDGISFFHLSAGISHTRYFGTVEDGVEFSFVPKSGSGFEALSSSKNIFYNVDLEFTNPYISLSYTNWMIVRYALEGNYLLPSTYGIGLIFQKTDGKININGIDNLPIAEASYESGVQRFYHLGWSFNYEFLFVSIVLRHVTSPKLRIDSCNNDAVGELACERFEAATGNRNNATTLFNGGVLDVGMLF